MGLNLHPFLSSRPVQHLLPPPRPVRTCVRNNQAIAEEDPPPGAVGGWVGGWVGGQKKFVYLKSASNFQPL